MATLANVISFARAQAQTDSNGLNDTNAIIFANEALVDFHRRLVEKGVDASQVQEAYTSGTANQGTYSYPTNLLFLKSISLNYTDSAAQNYRTASQIDAANLPSNWLSLGDVRTNADTSNPYFDDRGDWFEIFPTPTGSVNLNQLIRILYFKTPTEYTSTGDTISYPESQDIRILGWRIAAMFYYSLNKMGEGDAFNMKYEERVLQYISTLSRGAQQPIQAATIQLTGWEF